jgi:two-component system chemotaxis response regulator CheY
MEAHRDACVDLAGMNVLVVDDDDMMRATVVDFLHESRAVVVEAPNGDAALRYLENFIPDVVITDIYMPQMDGIEMIRVLRTRFPGMGIVAMTGGYGDIQVEPVTCEMILRLGADVVLRKPFHEEELCDVIHRVARTAEGLVIGPYAVR